MSECANTRASEAGSRCGDAVERDRQRAEDRQPARPAVDAPERRVVERDNPPELSEDARAGRHLDDREGDGGGRDRGEARDRGGEARRS